MTREPSPEEIAAELLGRDYNDLDEEEQRVLCRVVSKDIELDEDEEEVLNQTVGSRLADKVAAVGGSWGFICVFAVVLFGWMLINSSMFKRLGMTWDEYPYVFLNLMLSTVAAFQAPVIMMSQNRAAKKDRISNRHDYEINLRTTVEILKLGRKVDVMMARLNEQAALMPAMSAQIDEISDTPLPEKTAKVLEKRVPEMIGEGEAAAPAKAAPTRKVAAKKPAAKPSPSKPRGKRAA